MKLLLLLSVFLPVACTIGPVATEKGVSMGASFGTKTEGYYAKYTGKFGTIETGSTRNDETIVPAKIVNSQTMLGLARETTAGLKVTENTKVGLAKEETSRAATKSAADVEKTRILNPVEEAPLPAPVPAQ